MDSSVPLRWQRRSSARAGRHWCCANCSAAPRVSTISGAACRACRRRLLSKRLKELEEAGVIVAVPTAQAGVVDYRLTDAGEELRGVVESLGIWGQRWVESSLTLKNLDPSLLMWDMRRNLKIEPLPTRRCTINFTFPELDAARKSWWLVIDGGKVDLCGFDPGYEVDLYVRGSLYSMTVGVDGPLDAEVRSRRRQDRAHRRQGHRRLDEPVAGPEPAGQRVSGQGGVRPTALR